MLTNGSRQNSGKSNSAWMGFEILCPFEGRVSEVVERSTADQVLLGVEQVVDGAVGGE